MTTRRDFLKTLTMASFVMPANFQWDFTKSKVDGMAFPADDDPDYWRKIRKMFPMPEDQAFFNTVTLGAQPKVVLESTIAHMRKVATDIAEWDYKGDDWISSYQPYTDLRAKLGRLINAETEEIAISHMTSGTGSILPVKQICAEAQKREIFTVLDGTQCVGHIPVDVKDIGCDAYFSSLHKWMLAPPGTGLLYIRKERIADIWTTFASGQWDNHEDEGFRLSQRGTGNLSLLVGLDAALDFHFRIGPEKV